MSSSRKKEKRSRTSSSDTNNSFVSNVTSRVAGFLPVAITSWFSSPSTPSANGLDQASAESSDEDVPPSPTSAQPPQKRMRLARANEYHSYDVGQTNCVRSNIETTERRTTYATIQYPPQRNSYRWEANNETTPLRPTENSGRNEKDKNLQLSSQQHSSMVSPSSVPVKRKSLFDIPHTQAKAASTAVWDPNKPCFKPSLLGSPFYPGRTMYGGASQYVYHPNIRQRKELKVAQTTSADNSISYSASRIMDMLEHYSSPLNDSRRIPEYTRPSINNISNTSIDLSSPNTSKPITSFKTQELHVPNIASILRIKQRSRLMDTTAVARQIIASHSSTAGYPPYYSPQKQNDRGQSEKESSNKLTTKVKSRLTRLKRGEQCDLETELPTPLHLPSAVLHIDQSKLPKFSLESPARDIARPAITATVTRPVEEEPATNALASASRKFDTFKANNFKFASPVKISTDHHVQPATSSGYTFGSPERVIHRSEGKDKKEAAPKSLENNVSKLQCSGFDKSEEITSKTFEPITKKNDTEKSGDYLVSNDADAVQCVCSSDKKTGASSEKTAASDTNHAGKQWKCNDCWIQNKSDVAQCVACGGARPGSEDKSKPADSFKITLKKQSSKWECPTCLVSNDNEKTKCACCDTEKPGSTTSAAAKTTFNFGTGSTAFKFGIPNAQENDTAPPFEIKARLKLTNNEESETNNNIISKAPSFTFGLPSTKTEDKPDGTVMDKLETSGTTKLNFSFGIVSKSNNETCIPAPSVSTGITLIKSNEDKGKPPQEVSKTNLSGIKSPETPKAFVNFFAPPASLSAQENKSSIASTPTVENISEPTASSAAVTIIASTPRFTFGAVQPAVSLFGAPAAAPAADSTTPVLTFGAPATTAATLMQTMKPAINTFDADTTKPPTLTSNSSPAPLFSFGLNSQNTATKSEPPKFNFTFGSNTKAENALIQPPLTKTEDNSSANIFSTNAFGSVNNALTNSLGVVNGLPAATSSESSGTVQVSNAVPSGRGLFGSTTPKESMWPASGTAPGGIFAASVPASTPQKPVFSFGSSTPFTMGAPPAFGATTQATPAFGAINIQPTSAFGVNNQVTPAFGACPQTTPAFGTNTQPTPAFGTTTQSTPAFGAPAQSTPTFGAVTLPAPAFGSLTTPAFGSGAQSPPAFGSSTTAFGSDSKPAFGASAQTPSFGVSQQPSTNPFGMAGANGASQSSPFGTGPGNTSTPGLFQASSMVAPTGGLFGSASAAAPTFGSPTPTPSTFEAPSLTSTPFNFTPQSGAVFGFGQQTPQPQNAGIYSFGGGGAVGGASMGGGGMQFNMGSGASMQARRVRKAVRRTNNLRQ